MKDDNIFLWVKAVIAAACGAFTAAFGWLGWLVVAWAACMVLDWLSGSAAGLHLEPDAVVCQALQGQPHIGPGHGLAASEGQGEGRRPHGCCQQQAGKILA